MQPTLDFLVLLARRSGEILRAGFGQPHQITMKSETDLVTEIDHRSEAYLINEIQQHFPEHYIVTEESGHLEGSPQACWYLDPLDGTINYAHGLPFFAVSVAYAQGEHVMLAAVYDPLRDEMFSAERGRGAWLNNAPIRVSQRDELIESLLVSSFPKDDPAALQESLRYFAYFLPRVRSLRRMGSAVLDICYVACGRLDGMWAMQLEAWDAAAGVLLVEEAGGVVTKLDGSPYALRAPHDLIAANPRLHPKLAAGVNAVRKGTFKNAPF
jgi:myo-inositol-1(or 4)-monophosphatase